MLAYHNLLHKFITTVCNIKTLNFIKFLNNFLYPFIDLYFITLKLNSLMNVHRRHLLIEFDFQFYTFPQKTLLFYSIFPFSISIFNSLWVFFVCGIQCCCLFKSFILLFLLFFFILYYWRCHQCFLLLILYVLQIVYVACQYYFLVNAFFIKFFAIFMLHCISHDYLNVTRHFKRMALKVKKQSNCMEPKINIKQISAEMLTIDKNVCIFIDS